MSGISEIEQLLDDYGAWLRDNTSLREINDGWIEITTPYIDRHNDSLQIYARGNGANILLTDDGYTIHDLEISGCVLNTDKRRELLRVTLAGFGVKLEKNSLEVTATPETFALRKHNLIQAMLALNDLFYLAKPMVENLFLEDVVEWLDKNDVRYIAKASFKGVSGYDHPFDFVIPKSKQQPERILQAMNKPTRDMAESLIYKWTDTKETRSPESTAIALLNDTSEKVSPSVMEALQNYSIRPVPWSARNQLVRELTA